MACEERKLNEPRKDIKKGYVYEILGYKIRNEAKGRRIHPPATVIISTLPVLSLPTSSPGISSTRQPKITRESSGPPLAIV